MSSPDPTIATDASRELAAAHLDTLIDDNNRQIDIEYEIDTATEIRRVGVVGAGAMGTKIAAAVVAHGSRVALVDQDGEALDRALDCVRSVLRQPVDGTSLTDPTSETNVVCSQDLSALAECDVIIESVPEKPEVKKTVLRGMEQAARPGAALATNTSTIAIGRLAEALDEPSRFCGLHFFMPDSPRPILEVIPGPATSRATVALGAAFARRLGHMPLVVADGVGFMANRLVMSYMSAGLGLLQAGVDLLSIERAAREFGMSMGPFQLYDEIGVDVALHCGWCLALTSDELMARSPLHVAMVKAKYLGRKVGQGFFTYEAIESDQRPTSIYAGTQALIDRWAASEPAVEEQSITDALVLPMVLEATRLLAEGRARNPGQIDLGAVFGFGFPHGRGGPLYWADMAGAARLLRSLAPLEHLGPGYRPTPMLLEMASHDRPFYEPVNHDDAPHAETLPAKAPGSDKDH